MQFGLFNIQQSYKFHPWMNLKMTSVEKKNIFTQDL
jgi:acyl-CoA-binding protein